MKYIHAEFQRAFRGRKNQAKRAFVNAGGYDYVEDALAAVPKSMEPRNWKKAIDYFHTPEHRKSSAANIGCRQKQQFTNRGGSSKFCNASYNLVRLNLYTY